MLYYNIPVHYSLHSYLVKLFFSLSIVLLISTVTLCDSSSVVYRPMMSRNVMLGVITNYLEIVYFVFHDYLYDL